ncbi:cytochrome P450 [Sistotremastrum niveocremeum HHB9708]|uniref:Cytochrome P450 n=1 Tax=Sistotremastrum niveocremeum HHB9708 TaxID=1314777 RepID=A0A164PHR0_9AGAM|nr:cytochrome P450 [Sistotremastrum niveocremeum HHB9708]
MRPKLLVIFLNHFAVANDLLSKRSRIYSDRPRSSTVMFGKLVGMTTLIMWCGSEDPVFPKFRRMFAEVFGKGNLDEHSSIVEDEREKFLDRLSSSPGDFYDHIEILSESIILRIAYGYQLSGKDDKFYDLYRKFSRVLTNEVVAQRWIVDYFPILQFLPRWLPGLRFHKFAEEQGRIRDDFNNMPYDFVKQEIKDHRAAPSFVSNWLLKSEQTEADDTVTRYVAAAMYLGGADTTAGFLKAFFYLMAMHPEVQAKAQAEIDAVVGVDHSPDITHWKDLPFLHALMKEVHRWQCIVPLGIPHRLTEDDEYEGIHISGGTTVIANIWAMCYDEDQYPEPSKFNPERFIPDPMTGKVQQDPNDYVFGFGRRICPGMHFANRTLFLMVSAILSSFTISKCLDDAGGEIEPKFECFGQITRHLRPFNVRIIRRK